MRWANPLPFFRGWKTNPPPDVKRRETLTPWPQLPLGRRIRYRLEHAALAFAAWLIPKLPLASLRGLAWLLGGAAYVFDSRGRRIALANLEMVFGGAKTPEEIRRIARDSYRQFARTMLELFWAPNLRHGNYKKYVEVEGSERVQEVCKGSGVIGVLLHYGNFEWLGIISGFEVSPGVIVTQQFRNPLLGPIFDRLRSTSGHRVIQQQRSLMTTLKHLKSGGSVGILTDLQLHPRDHPVAPLRSFGRLSPITKMHAILHKRTGLPILPLELVPLPHGRYRFIAHEPLFFPPEATEQEIVQKCWDLFEPQIRRQPEPWLWAYKHWRFLPPDDAGGYPWYARRDKNFDRLLEDEG